MEDTIEQRSSEPECEDFEPDMDVQYQEDAVNDPEGAPLARKAVLAASPGQRELGNRRRKWSSIPNYWTASSGPGMIP